MSENGAGPAATSNDDRQETDVRGDPTESTLRWWKGARKASMLSSFDAKSTEELVREANEGARKSVIRSRTPSSPFRRESVCPSGFAGAAAPAPPKKESVDDATSKLFEKKVVLIKQNLVLEEQLLRKGEEKALQAEVRELEAKQKELRTRLKETLPSITEEESSPTRPTPTNQQADLNILLHIAGGIRGSIGPADVDRELAAYHENQCKEALEKLPDNPSDNHVKHFRAKLELAKKKNKRAEKNATERVKASRKRYRDLVPLLGKEVAAGLRRTEADYASAMDTLRKDQGHDLANLVRACQLINKRTPVLVPEKVPNDVDSEAIVVEVIVDGTPTEARLLTQNELLASEVELGKITSGKTRVKLLEKEQDTWKEYKEVYTTIHEVDIGAIMGGRPPLRQKVQLPDEAESWSPEACYAVFQAAAKTLQAFEEVVEKVVIKAMRDHEIPDGAVILHFASIKKFDRACAKTNEKYNGDFSRLLDLVRLTIECSEVKYITALIEGLDQEENLNTLRVKNRLNPAFACAESAGYRDVLINVEYKPTKHICEIQLTLTPFRKIKVDEGHDCYKVSRSIGMNTKDVWTHTGVLDDEALSRVKHGVIQVLNLDGTQVTEKFREKLCDGLASPYARLVELNLGYCFTHNMKVPPITEVLSPAVLQSIAGTIQVIDIAKNKMPGQLEKVKFDGCKHLRWLRLGSNRLTGPIPDSICTLERLQNLFLEKNELEGSIPEDIGDLKHLNTLNAYKNRLSGSIPTSMKKLVHLKGLFLMGNTLEEAIPDLSQLVHLEKLGLDDNNLSGPLPTWLGDLESLQECYLQKNSFEGEIPVSLGRLSNLKMLYLQDNKLTGPIPEELGNLAQLERLKLVDNQLTGGIPKTFSNLKTLTVVELPVDGECHDSFFEAAKNLNVLRVQCTREGVLMPSAMYKLPLTELNLTANVLCGEVPDGIRHLNLLEKLCLGGNEFDDRIPVWFGELKRLKVLELQNNHLKGPIPEVLGDLSSLTALDLSGNELTGRVPESFVRLSKLEFVAFTGNNLAREAPLFLLRLAKLKVVRTASAWAETFQIAANSDKMTSIEEVDGERLNKPQSKRQHQETLTGEECGANAETDITSQSKRPRTEQTEADDKTNEVRESKREAQPDTASDASSRPRRKRAKASFND